jgi:ankyrin repeat protein
MVAAQTGQQRVIDALLARRADPDRRDGGDRSALYWAIFEGHEDCALALLAAGAEFRRPSNAYTPAHWARVMNRTAVLAAIERANSPREPAVQ